MKQNVSHFSVFQCLVYIHVRMEKRISRIQEKQIIVVNQYVNFY